MNTRSSDCCSPASNRVSSVRNAGFAPFPSVSPLMAAFFPELALGAAAAGARPATRAAAAVAAPVADRGSAFVPPITITEQADRFIVEADVPGFKLDQIDVQLDDDVLTISGVRDAAAEQAGVLRQERVFGSFSRSVAFAEKLAVDGVAATMDAGVLTIMLPKAAPVNTARKITVKPSAPVTNN
jgi:HSP20 family protein